MPRSIVMALAASCLLTGCVTERPRSAYDISADEFGPDGQTRCERYAYETGRQRFEFLTSVSGEAFAALNANRAARDAFERCSSGRLN